MEVLHRFSRPLQPGAILYLGPEVDPLTLMKCRPHREGLLMTFEGYTTPEEVGQFRNQVFYVKADDRPPLAEGEYYHHQLIGLHVITDAGHSSAIVTEILETGASDVLVIRPKPVRMCSSRWWMHSSRILTSPSARSPCTSSPACWRRSLNLARPPHVLGGL